MAEAFVGYNDEDARIVGFLHAQSERLLNKWLFEVRVTLCDLIHGRIIRARAEQIFGEALWLEAVGASRAAVTEALENAAHLEWIATISERGQVYWGGRKNREGKTPEDVGA